MLARQPVELVLCGHQHIFQLGGLSADGRAIPVVGAPSASLHGGDRHHEGGYIIYDLIAEPAQGWAIDLELRRFDLSTGALRPGVQAPAAGRHRLGRRSGWRPRPSPAWTAMR